MLTLPIKRKWLEMIRSGQKKEEYRALSPYYAARFKRFLGWEFIPASQAQVESALRVAGSVPFKDVILRAGYSLSAPATMISGYITISTGRPEWGAAEGEEYYVLHITGMEDLLTDDWSRKTGKKTKLTGTCEDWRSNSENTT